MRARRWLWRELERRRANQWPFYWYRPLTQAEEVVLEALRVRRNVVR